MYEANHYIPQVYIKGFLDTITPEGQNPFVWRYDSESRRVRNRAPKKILAKKDLYTQYDKDLNPIKNFEKYFTENVDTPFDKFKKKYEKAILGFDQTFLYTHLKGMDKLFIAHFIRWQMKRTKGFMQEIEKRSLEIYGQEYPGLLEMGYAKTKNFRNDIIDSLVTTGNEYDGINFLESLNQRNIIFSVIETKEASFISSDNPVLRTNAKFVNSSPVEDPETEFTIPLTSKIAVSLYQFGSKVFIRRMQSKREIRNINQSFAKNAYNTIFGSNKELIESLVNFIPMKEES